MATAPCGAVVEKEINENEIVAGSKASSSTFKVCSERGERRCLPSCMARGSGDEAIRAARGRYAEHDETLARVLRRPTGVGDESPIGMSEIPEEIGASADAASPDAMATKRRRRQRQRHKYRHLMRVCGVAMS